MNIRVKGANGEREVCMWLNRLIGSILDQKGLPPPVTPIFQRNQNQSAVGGSDITNPYGLCIEVKRQEVLAIPQWWKQATHAAEAHGGIPILMYRQNGKRKWKIMFLAEIAAGLIVPVTISEPSFEAWFAVHIENRLEDNYV